MWRYQIGNQNSYIEKGQTLQWPTEKVQKDKQRSTKHTYKIKDREYEHLLKPGVNTTKVTQLAVNYIPEYLVHSTGHFYWYLSNLKKAGNEKKPLHCTALIFIVICQTI
jgi:hypothetical protein